MSFGLGTFSRTPPSKNKKCYTNISTYYAHFMDLIPITFKVFGLETQDPGSFSLQFSGQSSIVKKQNLS